MHGLNDDLQDKDKRIKELEQQVSKLHGEVYQYMLCTLDLRHIARGLESDPEEVRKAIETASDLLAGRHDSLAEHNTKVIEAAHKAIMHEFDWLDEFNQELGLELMMKSLDTHKH